MASISARSFSLLSILSLFLAPVCLGSSNSIQVVKSNEAKKVALGLYYESLCPYSANFIINGLNPIFDNGLIDIVDLKLFPWGNAKLDSDNTIVCQHGPYECLLNTVEACAIDAWPDLNKHFPFINCVEKLASERKSVEWQTCFDQLGLDPKPIYDCYSSGNGKKLDLKYANDTESLRPPHEYVPWVVVDDEPLYEDYENFTSYVCKAYKGSLPSACNDLSLDTVLRKKTDEVHLVSYTEEAAKGSVFTKIPSIIRSRVLRVIHQAVM